MQVDAKSAGTHNSRDCGSECHVLCAFGILGSIILSCGELPVH